MTDDLRNPAQPTCPIQKSWEAMFAAIEFALPFMEELANSGENDGEHLGVQSLRKAVALAIPLTDYARIQLNRVGGGE
jgi:hypothetical protein